MDAGVENAVAHANHGAVVQRIGEIDARREILAGLPDAAGLRPIRIGDSRLQQPGFFVSQTIAEGDLFRYLPRILRVEVDIAGPKLLDGISESLRERRVILRADRRVAGEIP